MGGFARCDDQSFLIKSQRLAVWKATLGCIWMRWGCTGERAARQDTVRDL